MQYIFSEIKKIDTEKPPFNLSFRWIFSGFNVSFRGCNSAVEYLPFKQRVDGSNPSTLTKIDVSRWSSG